MAGNDDKNSNDFFRRMLDINNTAQFTAKFTGNHKDTLRYIFEMNKFCLVNGIRDESVQFQRIFNSMPLHFQNRFMIRYETNKQLTVAALQEWILSSFPPPQTKFNFVMKLKSMVMRLDEDPLLVYERYTAKLAQVNKAIALMNKDEPHKDERMRQVTNEQQ
eukprot:799941_1